MKGFIKTYCPTYEGLVGKVAFYRFFILFGSHVGRGKKIFSSKEDPGENRPSKRDFQSLPKP